jgi:hypothetical protein
MPLNYYAFIKQMGETKQFQDALTKYLSENGRVVVSKVIMANTTSAKATVAKETSEPVINPEYAAAATVWDDYPEEDYPEEDYPEEDYPEEDYPEEDYPEEDYPYEPYPEDYLESNDYVNVYDRGHDDGYNHCMNGYVDIEELRGYLDGYKSALDDKNQSLAGAIDDVTEMINHLFPLRS